MVGRMMELACNWPLMVTLSLVTLKLAALGAMVLVSTFWDLTRVWLELEVDGRRLTSTTTVRATTKKTKPAVRAQVHIDLGLVRVASLSGSLISRV